MRRRSRNIIIELNVIMIVCSSVFISFILGYGFLLFCLFFSELLLLLLLLLLTSFLRWSSEVQISHDHHLAKISSLGLLRLFAKILEIVLHCQRFPFYSSVQGARFFTARFLLHPVHRSVRLLEVSMAYIFFVSKPAEFCINSGPPTRPYWWRLFTNKTVLGHRASSLRPAGFDWIQCVRPRVT